MALVFKLLLLALKTICSLWNSMMVLFQTQIQTRIGKKILLKELDVSMNGGGLFLMIGIKLFRSLVNL